MSGELDLLVERYLGGAAGEEDVRRLEDLLKRDAEARRGFLLAVDEDAALRKLVFAVPAAKEPMPSWPVPPAEEARPGAARRRKIGSLAIAALLLILAVIWVPFVFLGKKKAPSPAPPAVSKTPAPRLAAKGPGSKPEPKIPVPAAEAVPAAPEKPPAAAPNVKTYYFGGASWQTFIEFKSPSSAGPIVGWSRKISGSATIDFDAGTGKFDLSVPVDSLTTGVASLDAVMRSERILNAAMFPRIEFKVDEASCVDGEETSQQTWEILGQLTMRGKTKGISIEDESTLIRLGKLKTPEGETEEGEWIRVVGRFLVFPSSFGMEPYGVVPQLHEILDGCRIKVDLLGSTVKPADSDAGSRPPAVALKDVRPPSMEPPQGPGKLYRLGRSPQFTLVRAEGSTWPEKTVLASRGVSGWLRLDLENGTGKVKVEIPSRSFLAMGGDIDRWVQAKLPDIYPMIRFESTEVSRKVDSTWSMTGNLQAFGKVVKLYLEPRMKTLEADDLLRAGLESREALRFHASFKAGLYDLVPNLLARPESYQWTLEIDVLAEAEE